MYRLMQLLHRSNSDADRGQSTAEYALLILGAAAIALIVLSWATGTDKITSMLDAVIDSVIADI